jgi:hypothetical protein
MALATWLLFALLSLATAYMAASVAHHFGMSKRAVAVAGLAAGAMTLWPPFLSSYQAFGFENSILAAIALAVCTREILSASPTWRSVVVCAAAAVVVAHSWQLVLPAASVAVLFVAWAVSSRLGLRSAGPRLGVITILAGSASIPALVAVVTGIGLGHATDAGVEAPLPEILLILGLLASGAVAVRGRSRSISAAMGVIMTPTLAALGVAMAVGIPVTQYYPNKLLWHSAALGLAPLAVVVVAGARDLRRRNASLSVMTRAAVSAGIALAIGFAFLNPASAFGGAWSTVEGDRLLTAVATPGADRAQVVWLGSVGDDTIGRILLDFYRAGSTPERTPQPPLSVESECSLLRRAVRPVVLTNSQPAAARVRYRCVSGLDVVKVSTG